MSSILRYLLFLILLVVCIAGIAIYWTFYRPLPDYSASVTLDGLRAPVDVHWDPFGIPHIYAENEADLYYAVGYVHAQDRLWQMTLSQIAAEGRFAEFFGPDLIDFDHHQRTLGFWETAKRIDCDAPDEITRVLDAYARGVNAYVEENRRHLPIEFTLTGVEPIPWTTAHSHVMARLMAWEMNVSWWSELTYAWLDGQLPESTLQELFPEWEPHHPTMMDREQSSRLASQLAPMVDRDFALRQLIGRDGTTVGSNAWVVDGSRTASGLPLLAGDPHTALTMPGHWYELHLSLNGRNLSGGTIPGAPLIVVGQNDHLAWSMTNMMPDDTDFFIEIPDPEAPLERYVADSLDGVAVHHPFDWREEVIRVQGEDDELYRIRHTRHGPIISDIYPNRELAADHLISMRWTGHDPGQELLALYRLNWSENMESFRSALELFHSPGQNFAYGDREGNIAIFSAARLPVRDHHPLLFRKGWDPTWDWQEWIPFNEMPHVINPESGYVANANNKLHTDDYPHYIGSFWEPPSRITRIETFLSGSETVDVELFQQMQSDTYSVFANELLEFILPVLRASDHNYDFSEILPYLENWDFHYSAGSTAATLFDTFLIRLTHNTLLDDIGSAAFDNFIRSGNLPERVMSRMIRQDSFLFDDRMSPDAETRDEIILRSMHESVSWLGERYGEEPFQWRWEDVHTLTLRPPLFAEAAEAEDASAALKLIVRNLLSKGPYPVVGNSLSLNKGAYSWHQPFEMNLGASIRRIVDLSNLGRSYSVIATGQSGNPLSEYFGDQTDLWLSGQYRYMYQDSTFFREISYETMRLLPDR